MRKLTPYEINLLTKYGLDPHQIAKEVDKDIPIEYVIKIGSFYENEFYLTQNTLIPRVETEFLIELGLKYVIDHKINNLRFADVGTGSGAIGITFALELHKRNIHYKGILSDISDGALKVAEKNLKEYEKIVEDKLPIIILKANLLKLYPVEKLDIIFANLPYIPTSRISQLPTSVRAYEPLTALDGGEDGLEYIRQLLEQAHKLLKPEGIILLEVDDTHNKNAAKEFQNDWNIDIKNDFNGRNRFWVASALSADSSF